MSGAGRCAVCRDPQRRALEQAHIAGVSIRSLAKQYGRDKSTIHKHLRDQTRAPWYGNRSAHA